MKSFKIGDRVVLTKRVESTRLEIDTKTILVIEDLTNDSISLRYGKRKEQVFTTDLNCVSIRPITVLEIAKMSESNSIVLDNLNPGQKGIINGKEFTVSKVYLSSSIFTDYFEIAIKGEEPKIIPADQMTKLLNLQEKSKSTNKLPESKGPKIDQKDVSEDDLKKLVSSILRIPGKNLVLELPTPEEFESQLVNFHKQIQKEKESEQTKTKVAETKSSVKPIQPIGTLQEKQTTTEVNEKFEKELVKINERIEKRSKSSKIKIDGIDIELLESGEIKVPPITRKNLSDISDVLNKLDTILNFKGEK